MTVEEMLVRRARLWDANAVAQAAKAWLKGDGLFFQGLKGSQVSGLAGEVWKAKDRTCLLRHALQFTRKCAKRGAGWTEETSRILRRGMHTALQEARVKKSLCNLAFDLCLTRLPEGRRRASRRARDLEILREYFSAIVRAHQAIQAERRSGTKWTDFSN